MKIIVYIYFFISTLLCALGIHSSYMGHTDIISGKLGLSKGIELDTKGGIVSGKHCLLYKKFGDIPSSGESSVNHMVQCMGGPDFVDNVVELTGSTREEPPYLMYNNYIGSYIKDVLSDVPGTKRRMMYFKGEPQKVEKED